MFSGLSDIDCGVLSAEWYPEFEKIVSHLGENSEREWERMKEKCGLREQQAHPVYVYTGDLGYSQTIRGLTPIIE